MQALRYHFISRPEIRIMLILVNVFALASITRYAFHKITALAFLVGIFMDNINDQFLVHPAGYVYRRAENIQE